jgi:L-2-hydroxyglutarate oxidase LhgO
MTRPRRKRVYGSRVSVEAILHPESYTRNLNESAEEEEAEAACGSEVVHGFQHLHFDP